MPYAKDFETKKDNHDYEQLEDSRYQCKVCGHTVKRDGGGVCVGVPIIYKWDDIPDTMGTKTKLAKDFGLKLIKGQLPVAAKYRYDRKGKFAGYYPLYSVDEAVPKAKPTEKQLEALAKGRYMAEKLIVKCCVCREGILDIYSWWTVTRKEYLSNQEKYNSYTCERCGDEKEAIEWATGVLEDDTVIILDTETTDLDGEIIELAIIDNQGNTVFNSRIKPQGEMNPKAQDSHGISLEDLQDAPTFPELYEQLKSIIEGKRLITYNFDFDYSHLCRACLGNDLPEIKPLDSSACAMTWYAQWYGDYSSHWGNYKWQPLYGGDHTALGDCLATLESIKRMASNDD